MILRSLCARLLTALLDFDYLRKDEEMMAKIYFNRLLVGTITFDTIPAKYQDAVRAYGIQYVKDGKMSAEEYEQLFKEAYPAEE